MMKKINLVFFSNFVKRMLMSLPMMYIFIYCIYTRYIDAFIKVLIHNFMEAHHDLNHKTISKNKEQKN
jgi:hypothetical protein